MFYACFCFYLGWDRDWHASTALRAVWHANGTMFNQAAGGLVATLQLHGCLAGWFGTFLAMLHLVGLLSRQRLRHTVGHVCSYFGGVIFP